VATKAQMKGYGFSFQLTGLKELMDALEQLPTIAMKKGVIRNALKEAAKPIEEAAKSSVPVVTGNLRDSIGISTSLKPSQRKGRFDRSSVTVYIGSSAPHAHLVEFGTVERVLDEPRIVTIKGRTVKITTTGFMPPNPFLRNAWDANKEKALKLLGQALWRQIAKSARRLAKKAARGTLTRRQIEGLNK